MLPLSVDCLLAEIAVERNQTTKLIEALGEIPRFFISIIWLYIQYFILLKKIDSQVSICEDAGDLSLPKCLQIQIQSMEIVRDGCEERVLAFNEMIRLQRRLQGRWGFRYFIGWELELIDRMEDLVEDINISSDPEVRSLVYETLQKLSPSDVI